MTLEQLYRNYYQKDREALKLLTQTHWYSTVVGMDPSTYDALPKSQPLSKFLQTIYYTDKQLERDAPLVWKDRLWRIIEHAKKSLTTLFRNLNESPFRDHVILPLQSVRELDASSLQALARRPGRSIKEKLAGNPYLLAVRRYPSVDLPENRLLKAFAVRLSERLQLRKDFLKDNTNDELIFKIRSWLSTDEAKSIGRWENLPPNNTLLSHRDYRRIWDSWRWLQSLDDDISNDMKRLKERQNTMETWQGFAQMYINKKHIFAEVPIIFNNNSYDDFEIRTWDTILMKPKKEKFNHPIAIPSIDAPVCIDLTELRPRYAVLKDQIVSSVKNFREPFLWQRWENEELSASSFDMGLFTADAPFLHKDTITISSSELLFSNKYTQECLGCAAREFAKKLRETFNNDTLIWLQPDYLNDFELQITRSNINALFPNALPLPRSIAAVFEEIDYSMLHTSDFIVAVYDNIDGKECVTKLVAKFNKELKELVPKTHGYRWMRYPTKIISNGNLDENNIGSYDISTFNSERQYCERQQQDQKNDDDDELECRKLRRKVKWVIGPFKYLVDLTEKPTDKTPIRERLVQGGIKLYDLQKGAEDIPLWYDHIPKLSINADINDITIPYPLVSEETIRATKIKPIRNKAVIIPLKDELFNLDAGIERYYLSLGDKKIDYCIKLESPDIPLRENLKCKLEMTYTYGADNPYCLTFKPIPNQSVHRPIHVKWERIIKKNIGNEEMPSPEFPKPMSWDGLQQVIIGCNKTDNLLKKLIGSIKNLDNQLNKPLERVIGIINQDWHPNNEKIKYTFAKCEEADRDVYICEKNFINRDEYSSFQNGDCISFQLLHKKDGYSGLRIASPEYKETDEEITNNIIDNIRKSLYRPVIQIWQDGRSINDANCPPWFRKAIKKRIVFLDSLIQQDSIHQAVRDEILFLLSCLHKDTTENCIQWITDQVNSGEKYNFKAVGFALGDVSQPWQKRILDQLKANLNNFDLSYYSLRVFTNAIWREQHFIEQFNYSECYTILDCLYKQLVRIQPIQINENETNIQIISEWELKLLFGMLRTRASADIKIKGLLQLGSRTQKFIDQIDRIAEMVVKNNIKLYSRIQLRNSSRQKDNILNVLRLYLKGDEDVSAIRITGISDFDGNDK